MLTHLSEQDLQQIQYELTPIDILASSYTLENKKELKALEHSVKAYEFLYQKEKVHIYRKFLHSRIPITPQFLEVISN